jgi:hypothetical protein
MWAYQTLQNLLEDELDRSRTHDYQLRRQSLLQAFQVYIFMHHHYARKVFVSKFHPKTIDK